MQEELLTLHRDLYAVDSAVASMMHRPATSPASFQSSFHLPPVRNLTSRHRHPFVVAHLLGRRLDVLGAHFRARDAADARRLLPNGLEPDADEGRARSDYRVGPSRQV